MRVLSLNLIPSTITSALLPITLHPRLTFSPFSLYCSQLDKLQIVDVKDMFIDHADDPPSSIGEVCAAVRSLDLSANLIYSWKTVYDIATHLPHLSVLRLRSVHPQPQTIVS